MTMLARGAGGRHKHEHSGCIVARFTMSTTFKRRFIYAMHTSLDFAAIGRDQRALIRQAHPGALGTGVACPRSIGVRDPHPPSGGGASAAAIPRRSAGGPLLAAALWPSPPPPCFAWSPPPLRG